MDKSGKSPYRFKILQRLTFSVGPSESSRSLILVGSKEQSDPQNILVASNPTG